MYVTRRTIATVLTVTLLGLGLSGCSPYAGQRTTLSTPTTVPTATPLAQVYGQDITKILIGTALHVPDTSLVLNVGDGVQDFNQGPDRGDVLWGELFAARAVPDGFDVMGYVDVNHGGSGTQQYLVVYHVTENSKKNTSSIFIGDRIKMESIQVTDGPNPDEYLVLVTYLTRTADQPMVDAPTIKQTDQFVISNHLIKNGVAY